MGFQHVFNVYSLIITVCNAVKIITKSTYVLTIFNSIIVFIYKNSQFLQSGPLKYVFFLQLQIRYMAMITKHWLFSVQVNCCDDQMLDFGPYLTQLIYKWPVTKVIDNWPPINKLNIFKLCTTKAPGFLTFYVTAQCYWLSMHMISTSWKCLSTCS